MIEPVPVNEPKHYQPVVADEEAVAEENDFQVTIAHVGPVVGLQIMVFAPSFVCDQVAG